MFNLSHIVIIAFTYLCEYNVMRMFDSRKDPYSFPFIFYMFHIFGPLVVTAPVCNKYTSYPVTIEQGIVAYNQQI